MDTGDLAYTAAFYFFGAIAVIAAFVAVITNRILRAAVALAVTLVCGAAFYVLLNYDFVAAIQVLVYVGGIVVLIVYAILLTSSTDLVESRPVAVRKVLAFLAAVLFLISSLTAISRSSFSLDVATSPPNQIAAGLGRLILDTGASGYVIAFEVISFLLLAAVIGAIVIARSYRTKLAGTEHGEKL